jgi:urease accessory protein UreE
MNELDELRLMPYEEGYVVMIFTDTTGNQHAFSVNNENALRLGDSIKQCAEEAAAIEVTPEEEC